MPSSRMDGCAPAMWVTWTKTAIFSSSTKTLESPSAAGDSLMTITPKIMSFPMLIAAVLLATDTAEGQTGTSRIVDEVSYTNDIQPVVNNFCTTCHAGKNPEGDFTLTVEGVEKIATDPGKRVDQLMRPYDREGTPGGVVAVSSSEGPSSRKRPPRPRIAKAPAVQAT